MGSRLVQGYTPDEVFPLGLIITNIGNMFVLLALLNSINRNVFVSTFCSQEMYFKLDFSIYISFGEVEQYGY